MTGDSRLTRGRLMKTAAIAGTAGTAAAVLGVRPDTAEAATGPNLFNIRDYGAVGDGVTNDTAAVKAAVDAAYNRPGGGTVYIPNGQYAVTSIAKTLTSGNGSLNILGETKEGSILKKYDSSTSPILDFSNSTLDSHCVWRDFRILGNNKTHTGIKTTNMAFMAFENLHVSACNTAFYALGTLTSQWEKCFMSGNGYGIQLRDAPTGVKPNLNTLRNCVINANQYVGIDHGVGQLLLVDNCDLEANGTPGHPEWGAILIQPTVDDGIPLSSAPIHVRDCWFESNRGWCVQSYGGDLTVEGCFFVASENGQCVKGDGCQTVRCQNLTGTLTTDQITVTANTLFFYADGVRLRGPMNNSAQHSLIVGSQPLGVAADYMQIGEHGGEVPAPAANKVVLYARDNGAGKTQLCARFSSGAIQVLAAQP